MGAVNVIGYRAHDSALHRLDPRTKQILVMVLSTACFIGGGPFLSITTVALSCCIAGSGVGFTPLIREIRYFLFFVLFVFVVRSVTLVELSPRIDPDSVQSAAVFCWRLILVVIMGVLLVSTTRTADIRAALVWMLRPLPIIDERTAATMVGLVVRMIPLILLQAGEIGDAMRSRCIEARKNPLFRMKHFTLMLFRRAITRGDHIVDTMQARCYNEHRTLRSLSFGKSDAVAFASCALLLSVLFIG